MKICTVSIMLSASLVAFSVFAANPASTEYVDTKVRKLEAADNSLQTQINTIGGGGGAAVHYLGEFFQGGVIYWLDPTSTAHSTHGLIADIADKGIFAWSIADTTTGATLSGAYQGRNSGTFNTAKIISTPGTTYPAASACASSTSQGYSDWYLPSLLELNQMFSQQMAIEQQSVANGGSPFAALDSGNSNYWSSTENSLTDAWSFSFGSISQVSGIPKSFVTSVRCIRAF